MNLRSGDIGRLYSPRERNFSAALLLFTLVLVIYGNTFHSAWHLDDFHTIVNNPRLHLRDLTPQAVMPAFFASPDGGAYLGEKLYRPVSSLSFALNWYVHQDRVFGYHLVNILVHVFTAWILYGVVLNLFRSPRLKRFDEGTAGFVALLSAVLWAVNPIQTQAVTYIVQRMTLLAAMFYALGLYFYIKSRLADFGPKRILLLLGWVLCFFLALGSKENAITFPAAILLVEICFARSNGRHPMPGGAFWGAMFVCAMIVGLAALYFLGGKPLGFLDGFRTRPFSVTERLLTEPRIVWFYLSQIFLPLPSRFSIEHEVTLSTGWLDPWTNLPAILGIAAAVILGLVYHRRAPLLSFAVLFFFLNHVVESTALPLELIFEHRNYLPSMFLFFPIAFGIKRFVDRIAAGWPLQALVGVVVIVMVVSLGWATYTRNAVWADAGSLWQDAMQKAPGSARPPQNLATGYYEKIGDFDTALALYEKALNLKDHKPAFNKALTYANMASVYYRKEDYIQAVDYYARAIAAFPAYEKARYGMVVALIQAGSLQGASIQADRLLQRRPHQASYLNIKGLILLKLDQPEAALELFLDALARAPYNLDILYHTAVAYERAGILGNARTLFRRVQHENPEDIRPYFFLIENRIQAVDLAGADRQMDRLLRSFSLEYIKRRFREQYDDPMTVPVDRSVVAEALAERLGREAEWFGSQDGVFHHRVTEGTEN